MATRYSAKKLLSKLKARGIVDNACGRVVIDINADSDWVQLLVGAPDLPGKLGEQLPELLSRIEDGSKKAMPKKPKAAPKATVKPEPAPEAPARHALKR